MPYCKGGVMAKNPQWRGSWHLARPVSQWIARTKPEALLSVDIFFDCAPCMATRTSPTRLARGASSRAGEVAFAKLLAESAGHARRDLISSGASRRQDGRIDLKRTGLFGIVTFARALCDPPPVASARLRTGSPPSLRAASALLPILKPWAKRKSCFSI